MIMRWLMAALALAAIGALAPAPASAAQAARVTTLDLHHLPLGDGHISDTPRQGYVDSCQQDFMPDRGGAMANVPWIHGRTWDLTEKPHVEGRVTWPQAQFTIVIRRHDRMVMRIIRGNGLPVDTPTGTFPISPSDPVYQYDFNPNSIRAHRVMLRLPRDPKLAARPTCVPMGPIGIALNGVMIFNALDAGGRDAVAHEVQDLCDGHPQDIGVYHYHGPSPCLPGAKGRNQVIGYAFDGFGITSMYDAQGREITSADLDACHGRVSRIRWDGRMVRMYHYVLTQDYPYTIGCFRGTPTRVPRGLRGGGPPRGGPPPGGRFGPPPRRF